jgi:hypothetical protein
VERDPALLAALGWRRRVRADHANCVMTGHPHRQHHRTVNPSPLTSQAPGMNSTSRSHSKSFQEGDYLTDQRRLYRVLQLVPARFNRRAAILEDCRTLDTLLLRPKDLRRMRLQLVRPAPVNTVESHGGSDARAPVPALD